MSTKTSVLKILTEHIDNPVSGEKLSEQLSVSRNAIWKAINELRKEGYDIQAVTNKGYTLSSESDVLSVEEIGKNLQDKSLINQIHIYKLIKSTNIIAKEMAVNGAPHGTTVIAEAQTDARGRRGRGFFAPAGTGVYMSMVLHLDMKTENAIMITTAASVAIARAIESVTGIKVQIKWVNDLYLDGKKVCGISTDAIGSLELGHIENVVLGIGINVTIPHEDIPEELKDIITALDSYRGNMSEHISRNKLIPQIMENVLEACRHLHDKEFIPEYRQRSCVIGKPIYVISQDMKIPATALDIDDNGFLIVADEEDKIMVLNSGEISIRLRN